MKKALLLAASAFMALSVMAEVFPVAPEMDGEDITPAGYIFHTYDKDFIGYTHTPDILPFNMQANWYCKNYVQTDQSIGDGLIVVTGGQIYNKATNVDILGKATKIIDLGGTVGKVFCLNFAGSTFPAKYEEITGQSLEIGEALPKAQPLLFWHFDHNLLKNYLGQVRDGEDYMPLRIRVELNIFANIQSSTGQYWKAFVNDDQNNVRPAKKSDDAAPDILVNPAEFAYRWCEIDPSDPTDDAIYDDGENGGAGEWNPNRWLVYEWDINVAHSGDEENPFSTSIRLKNENPGGANHGEYTVLIRSIHLYAPQDINRKYIYKARPRTWNFYTTGKVDNNGIHAVTAPEGELTYNITGGVAHFNRSVTVYSLTGALVAEGSELQLENGIYIARSADKALKFVVK